MEERTTSTARIERVSTGVVVVRIQPGAFQSIDDARANLAASIEASGEVKRPLLVDITRCQPLEPAVRHYYSGSVLVESFLALALLIEASPLGAMMGNVYLRIAAPGIPTRLFTEDARAHRWLETLLGSGR